MQFAQRQPITDVCLLVEDLERSLRFYVDRLGFRLRYRNTGFADFVGAGLTLALWDSRHMSEHTGVGIPEGRGGRPVMIAAELPSLAAVDEAHAELSAKGVVFNSAPADYPWGSRSCFFEGPEGEIWELYAWHEGKHTGLVEEAGPASA